MQCELVFLGSFGQESSAICTSPVENVSLVYLHCYHHVHRQLITYLGPLPLVRPPEVVLTLDPASVQQPLRGRPGQ